VEARGVSGAIERVWMHSGSDTADLLMNRAMQALQARLISEFNAAWAHAGFYGSSPTDGAQTAQAAALALGVVPRAAVAGVVDYLVKDIAAHNGHLSVGIIGQKYLTRALTASGNGWLAANISMHGRSASTTS
jgi:hypothetical protein